MAEVQFPEVKDRNVATPSRVRLRKAVGIEGDDIYDVEAVPGTVYEEGTPLNKEFFDKLKLYMDNNVGSPDNPVPITNGGTGANTAEGARTNLDVYSKNEVDEALERASSKIEPHIATRVTDSPEGVHGVYFDTEGRQWFDPDGDGVYQTMYPVDDTSITYAQRNGDNHPSIGLDLAKLTDSLLEEALAFEVETYSMSKPVAASDYGTPFTYNTSYFIPSSITKMPSGDYLIFNGCCYPNVSGKWFLSFNKLTQDLVSTPFGLTITGSSSYDTDAATSYSVRFMDDYMLVIVCLSGGNHYGRTYVAVISYDFVVLASKAYTTTKQSTSGWIGTSPIAHATRRNNTWVIPFSGLARNYSSSSVQNSHMYKINMTDDYVFSAKEIVVPRYNSNPEESFLFNLGSQSYSACFLGGLNNDSTTVGVYNDSGYGYYDPADDSYHSLSNSGTSIATLRNIRLKPTPNAIDNELKFSEAEITMTSKEIDSSLNVATNEIKQPLILLNLYSLSNVDDLNNYYGYVANLSNIEDLQLVIPGNTTYLRKGKLLISLPNTISTSIPVYGPSYVNVDESTGEFIVITSNNGGTTKLNEPYTVSVLRRKSV